MISSRRLKTSAKNTEATVDSAPGSENFCGRKILFFVVSPTSEVKQFITGEGSRPWPSMLQSKGRTSMSITALYIMI
jgi:hypothetical protein